jgi:hypothetical protein
MEASDQKYRLISISQPRHERPFLDVVFVHGLTGGPYTTWNGARDEPKQPKTTDGIEQIDSDCAGEKYWPNWLDQDLRTSSINFWSLGYPAPFLAAGDPFGYSESLTTGVRPLVDKLLAAKIAGDPRTKLVFIGHSLGGLMIKAALKHAESSDDESEKRLAERCAGVAFIATPHAGSGLASLLANVDALTGPAKFGAGIWGWLTGIPLLGSAISGTITLGAWFAKPSNYIEWLKRAAPELRTLAEEYRSIAARRGLSTIALYETQPFKSLRPKSLMWIVDASNADPGIVGCRPRPEPYADHIGVCKPKSRESPAHVLLRDWIRKLAHAAKRGSGHPWLDDEIREVLEKIADNRPDLADQIRPTPRHLEEISTDLRTQITHEFQKRIKEKLNSGPLRDRLDNAPMLVDALEHSNWPFDRLLLIHWLRHHLMDEFRRIATLLGDETSRFERYSEPPSLIPTFELVDGFHDAIVEGASSLKKRLKESHNAIDSSRGTFGEKVDGGKGRTRQYLSSGIPILEQIEKWEKPTA